MSNGFNLSAKTQSLIWFLYYDSSYMGHPFKHFVTITKHRHRVIRNAARMGIFWHALKHDLSKYSYAEFSKSAFYYAGNHSPVYEQRLQENYFSSICQHHTKRNPHHWEYWTDFFMGRVIAKTMPYKYATEYVCDMLSASYVYNPKDFKPDTTLRYFLKHSPRYYMTEATKEYITWCLSRYAESGFKNLKKKDTKAKYLEIISHHPDVELFDTLSSDLELPKLKKK